MDSSASGTGACPTCDEQVRANHVCPEPTTGAPSGGIRKSLEETGRIQIPEALRNTGLFRAPWRPSPDQAAPHTVSNIFARVEEENPVSDRETPPAPSVEPAPAPFDPWAGLDTTVTPDPSEAPAEDPWAYLSVAETSAPLEQEVAADAFADLTPAPAAPVVDAPAADVSGDQVPEDEMPVDEVVAEAPEEDSDVEQVEELPAEELVVDEFTADEVLADATSTGEIPALVESDVDAFSADQSTIAAAEEEFWWSGESEGLAELESAELVVASTEPEETDAAHAVALSPIAAAEAEALAAGHPAPVSVDDTGVHHAPALDETAAMDLEAAFAAEAAAASDAHLEQVPEADQSAWDLYGESLYASEEQTTNGTGAPHEGDTSLVPGLSAASLSSASLPSSVPFAPGVGVDGSVGDGVAVEEPAARRSRKGLVAGTLALLLVAGGGGWFWWNSQQDAPVKDAFSTSHTSFTQAAAQLSQASSISEIASAGTAFGDAVPALSATEATSRESDSEVSVAARRATLAEKAVAEAAAPLTELSSADLSSWGEAKDALASSLEGLADVTADIETAGGQADRLPDPTVVDRLQDVIADEVVAGAGETVTDLSAKLEAAELLADIRAAGTSAREYVTPLKEAAAGLDDPAQRSELNAVVEFHEALGGFAKIRPATFGTWDDLKKDAQDTAKELSTGQDEARAGIKAADALVTKARETFEEWETANAEAKAARVEDLANLDAAEAAVTDADSTFSTLTDELSTLVRDVRGLPAGGQDGEAYTRLDAAAKAREAIVTSLTGLSITPGPTAKLEALLEVVTADAQAVRAAADAAARCTDACLLTETAGWKGLGTGTSGSAAAWSAAVTPFVDAVVKARERVEARELPQRPKI